MDRRWLSNPGHGNLHIEEISHTLGGGEVGWINWRKTLAFKTSPLYVEVSNFENHNLLA